MGNMIERNNNGMYEVRNLKVFDLFLNAHYLTFSVVQSIEFNKIEKMSNRVYPVGLFVCSVTFLFKWQKNFFLNDKNY